MSSNIPQFSVQAPKPTFFLHVESSQHFFYTMSHLRGPSAEGKERFFGIAILAEMGPTTVLRCGSSEGLITIKDSR